MKRLMSVYRLTSSRPVSGVASVVAPHNPLGRVGSAIAVTALLAGVQLGLLVGHSGSGLCRLAGADCSQAEPIVGGRVLENQAAGGRNAPLAGVRRSGPTPSGPLQAQSALRLQTVALRIQEPARHGQVLQPRTASSAKPGSLAGSAKRHVVQNSATGTQQTAAPRTHDRRATNAADRVRFHPRESHERRGGGRSAHRK